MKPELISPAGDMISLRACIQARADAVYFGVKQYNLRENAKNFEIDEIKEVIRLCHKNNMMAYLTLNSIIFDSELADIKKILSMAKSNGIDAVIAWDFSVIKLCDELGIPIHISTQASISNYSAIAFLKNKIKNLKCIVLARELSLEQIKKIIKRIKKNKLSLEIETFVHGAMCVSISGRCFISHQIFGKSANRGKCLQPCRRKYLIYEPEDKYQLELGEDYVLSPKDICTLPFIDKLVKAGISKFKIEGRNRSSEYVKTVTESYREAIDLSIRNKYNKEIAESLIKKVRRVYNRGYSTGFYFGLPSGEDITDSYGSKATTRKVYVGYVKNYYKNISVAEIKLESYGLKIGDDILIDGKTTGIIEQRVDSIELNNSKTQKAKKGEIVGIKTIGLVRRNDKVYLIETVV